jgi:hypothetical protein
VSIGRLFITGLSEEVADDVAVGLEEVAVLEIGFLEVVVEEALDDEEGFCDEGFCEDGFLDEEGFWDEDAITDDICGTELMVGTVGFITISELTGACCSYLLDAPSIIFWSTISDVFSFFDDVSIGSSGVAITGISLLESKV